MNSVGPGESGTSSTDMPDKPASSGALSAPSLPPISVGSFNSPRLHGVLSPPRQSPKPGLGRSGTTENLGSFGAPSGEAVGTPTPGPPLSLTIECVSRLGSPRIQSLSLELGHAEGSSSARSSVCSLEDSWKGEILPEFLFLGDRVTASDWDRLSTLRITHILNTTQDVSNFFESDSSLSYMRCPVQDRSDAAAEMARHFPACVAFLDSCRARNGRALVHCRAGVSRSATMVIGYLMQLKRWDLRTALRYVDTRRFVQPNSGFIDFLIGLERELFGTCSLSASDLGYAPD